MTRKTIEYHAEDLYMRYLFTESNGRKHYAIYLVSAINKHKKPPLGIASHNPKDSLMKCTWTKD